MTTRQKWTTGLALITAVWAAFRNFVYIDDGAFADLSGGTLTGPMMQLSYLGTALLLVGAFLQIWRSKSGFALSAFGLAAMLPFFSWLFAPGSWCAITGNCKGEYPLIGFHAYSAITLALTAISLTLQWRRRMS